MTAANRIGWIVAVVVCAGSMLPACSPENSGAADAGNSGAVDAGNSGAADAGNSGAADAGNSGAVDAGDPGATDAGDETEFGRKYKFADSEIAGWTQAPGDAAYSVWTDRSLDAKIDGASIAYVSNGCQMAMFQDLVGPDPSICTVVAMDFGTEARATSMFAFQQEERQATVTIPSYASDVAIGAEALTGVTVFAHFKASYFELLMDGYADPASAAKAAPQFLDVLKRKTQ